MDGVTDEKTALTEEQRTIVDLDVRARTIVVAGPGAGKTYTLVHRAAALASRDVAPSELLVLSFTNAVVGELRRRLAALSDSDVGYVRPMTIDSLAGRIVTRGGVEPVEGGFDRAVIDATAAVSQDPVGAGVARFRHVIVDEAQDLVGARLAFITALLRLGDVGFTVLGDPAQGIYGFSDRSELPRLTGIDVLCNDFPGARRMRLTGDRRSLRMAAAPGHELRPLVMRPADPATAYQDMLRRLRDSQCLSISQLALVLKRADERTGVLCRTNGEVLHLSGLLADAAVAHSVRRAAADRTAPAWVARLLGDVDASDVSRKLFDELAADAPPEWRTASWKAIRRLAPNRSGGVSMQRLRENLHRLNPEEAPDDAASVPVLSTVHRSKGLEYDTTIILEPRALDAGDATAEEVRVLYVAMTRARVQTLRLARPGTSGRLAVRAGRWIVMPWRGNGISRVELCVGDVESRLDRLDLGSARSMQRYLAGQVAPGDPIELSLTEDSNVYAVEHHQTRIGVTGAAFRLFVSDPPRRITGLRVDCVRSAAGEPARTQNLGIGSAGLWLVPEVVGLGCLQRKAPLDEQHG